jgi:hypothetical protein
MAFTLQNWTCISPSLNQGQETITPYRGSPTVENAPNIFMYGSPNDTAATISGSNYFLTQYASLNVGDWIMGFGTDTSFIYQVTASSSTSVTVEVASFPIDVPNNSITYAKIQETSTGNVLIGNPTGSAADVEEVPLSNGLSFVGGALQLNPSYLNVVEVSLTAAQWNGMYANPVQIIQSQGPNTITVVNMLVLSMTFGTTQFTGGGLVALQYGNTSHGAGYYASAGEQASDFTNATADTLFGIQGGLHLGALRILTINSGIYITNATAPFATGDSTFKIWVWYSVIPSNS